MNQNKSEEARKALKREDTMISLKYYIAHVLLTLGYARIWPVKSFSPMKVLLSTIGTIFFILINSVLLFSEIVAVTMNNDLRLFANIIGVIGMHAVGLIKWCYCLWKSKEVIDIVMKLESCHVLCQRLDNSEEGCRIYENEMEYAHKYSLYFLRCWTIACIYGVLHWCANPLLLEWTLDQISSINYTSKQRILPFVGWYPLNTNNIYNYICLYLMQLIGGISPALGIICYDTFYVTMLMVIYVQFQYINIIMMKTDKISANEPEAMFSLEKKLKNCVDCHVEIKKFLNMLQTFSGPTMFAQCIETLVILCLVSFEASVIKIAFDMGSILKLWSLLEYFLCAAFQLYIFCFFATQIEHLGLQVADSVYCCGWELVSFGKSKQLKGCDIGRLVQVIIVQAQRPIVLTGGPFYVLSLETFRVIMSMAISNSLILHTIADRDE